MTQPNHPEEPASITIPPLGMKKLELGEYPAAEDVPSYSYAAKPEGQLIVADEKVVETAKGVRLVVHIQNFGEVAAEVTAHLSADSAA